MPGSDQGSVRLQTLHFLDLRLLSVSLPLVPCLRRRLLASCVVMNLGLVMNNNNNSNNMGSSPGGLRSDLLAALSALRTGGGRKREWGAWAKTERENSGRC